MGQRGVDNTTKKERERREARAAKLKAEMEKINGKSVLNEYPVAVHEVLNDYPVEADHEMPPVKVNLNPVPTLEEAADDYQYGSQAAFNYIYRYYEGKLQYNAARYADEDVMQELSMVLMRCARKYRAGGSASFNTFFWGCAQNHLGMYQDRKNARKRCPESGAVISLNVKADDEKSIELMDTVADPTSGMDMDAKLFWIDLRQNLFPYISKRDQFIVTKLCLGVPVSRISKQLHISMPGVYNRIKHLRSDERAMVYLQRLQRQVHGAEH